MVCSGDGIFLFGHIRQIQHVPYPIEPGLLTVKMDWWSHGTMFSWQTWLVQCDM